MTLGAEKIYALLRGKSNVQAQLLTMLANATQEAA